LFPVALASLPALLGFSSLCPLRSDLRAVCVKSFLAQSSLHFPSPLLVHYTYKFYSLYINAFIHVLSGESMTKKPKKTVTGRVLHDPVKDKLRPIFPLDLSKIKTIDDLVRAMGNTAYTARQIGDAADVLEAMARDKDCFVVMTLSGALTVGKMGLVFCDLIESGIVKAVVSTGALMAHGLVEATGRSHFRYDPAMDDRELFASGYNRVYDSLEPEVNLDAVEEVMQQILNAWDADEIVCSATLNRRIGEYLLRPAKGRGILKSCAEK